MPFQNACDIHLSPLSFQFIMNAFRIKCSERDDIVNCVIKCKINYNSNDGFESQTYLIINSILVLLQLYFSSADFSTIL